MKTNQLIILAIANQLDNPKSGVSKNLNGRSYQLSMPVPSRFSRLIYELLSALKMFHLTR